MTLVLSRLGRGARRIGRAVRDHRVAPLAVAAVIAVVAVGVTLSRRTAEVGTGAVSTVRVGVSEGDSVTAYVAAQRAELTELVAQAPTTAVYALVSLDDYVNPEQVADLVRPDASSTASPAGAPGFADGPATITTIAAYARARVPGQQTELVRLPANRVPADLVAGMAEVADRKTRQAADYTARAERDDASRALYRSIAAVTSQEAAAYRGVCACVYALLVRAAPVILASVARRAGVRVVDSAPELSDPAHGVFVAPLPEQVGTVGPLP